MNSINRTLDILSYITTCASPVTPQSISSALEIPLSTVYLLTILIDWEFVSHANNMEHTVLARRVSKIKKRLSPQFIDERV